MSVHMSMCTLAVWEYRADVTHKLTRSFPNKVTRPVPHLGGFMAVGHDGVRGEGCVEQGGELHFGTVDGLSARSTKLDFGPLEGDGIGSGDGDNVSALGEDKADEVRRAVVRVCENKEGFLNGQQADLQTQLVDKSFAFSVAGFNALMDARGKRHSEPATNTFHQERDRLEHVAHDE